jgi:YfiH family protein
MPSKHTKEALHYIDWPVPNVLAFTTTRYYPQKKLTSTVKPPFTLYDQFNLGDHVGDDPQQVSNNRKLLLDYLPKNTTIQWLEQVHGNNVVIVENHSAIPYIADAAITQNKNITLAVMTADCLPILLTSQDGQEIAAIHGGWKPLAKDIILKTIEAMKSPTQEIVAWLGPCIGETAFVVGTEVKTAFTEKSSTFEQAFTAYTTPEIKGAVAEKKYTANLALIAKIQLNVLGINNISHLEHCTYHQNEYYSYRRENKTGRMATLISRL